MLSTSLRSFVMKLVWLRRNFACKWYPFQLLSNRLFLTQSVLFSAHYDKTQNHTDRCGNLTGPRPQLRRLTMTAHEDKSGFYSRLKGALRSTPAPPDTKSRLEFFRPVASSSPVKKPRRIALESAVPLTAPLVKFPIKRRQAEKSPVRTGGSSNRRSGKSLSSLGLVKSVRNSRGQCDRKPTCKPKEAKMKHNVYSDEESDVEVLCLEKLTTVPRAKVLKIKVSVPVIKVARARETIYIKRKRL